MMRIRNIVFGAAVLATLGFGASTARAEVGTIESEVICPFMRTAEECTECCADGGLDANWLGGHCTCY